MLVFPNQSTKAFLKCCVFVLWFSGTLLFSHSFSASSNFTHIYSDSSGTSFFCDVNAGGEVSFSNFSAGFSGNYSRIYSSLEKISVSANFFDADAFVKTKFVDFKASLFFLNADDLLLHLNADYKVEEARGFGMAFLMPVKFPRFTIAPLFSFGNLRTQNGDMHYFYSEPKIPLFYAVGSKLEIEKLKFAMLYLFAEMDFYANEQTGFEKLIASDIWATGFFSNYEFAAKNLRIVPSFGFFHLDLKASGNLNSKNQNYLLFPFKFFNLAGNVKIDALVFGANLRFKKSFYEISADFTAVLCVNQTGRYDAEYLHKKNLFFDGSQGTYRGELKGLAGNGISFLTISADFFVPIKKSTLVLSPKKIFLIPMFFNSDGMNVFEKGDSSSHENENRNFAMYYIFSGLSLSAKFLFP